MKILALTDIHGAYTRAAEIIKHEHPDVLVIGGDLTTVGSMQEAETAITQFQSICRTLLCVAGNMDTPQHDELFSRLGVSINGRGAIIGDVGFFGVSASPPSPLHTPNEITEEEISRRAARGYDDVLHVRVRIFVPHTPPHGTRLDAIASGAHVGSTAVREFIEWKQPDVVICGHIHEARGLDVIGSSRIVNCGPASKGYYAVITVDQTIEIHSH